MHRLALAAALILSALAPTTSRAAGWHYYDPECPIALGDKSMKFVAMQPKKNIDRVCDALPETGATVIALDAPDPELRETVWDISIARDTGKASADAESDVVFRLPVEKHRNGMVNFDLTIPTAGKYVLVAKLTADAGGPQYVGRHPFTVGMIDDADFYTYVGFGLFAAVVAGVGFVTYRRKQQRSAGKTA
jgi:hypothetical protein